MRYLPPFSVIGQIQNSGAGRTIQSNCLIGYLLFSGFMKNVYRKSDNVVLTHCAEEFQVQRKYNIKMKATFSMLLNREYSEIVFYYFSAQIYVVGTLEL